MIEIFTCVAVIVSMFVLSPVLASLIAFNQAHRIIDFWTVITITKINAASRYLRKYHMITSLHYQNIQHTAVEHTHIYIQWIENECICR